MASDAMTAPEAETDAGPRADRAKPSIRLPANDAPWFTMDGRPAERPSDAPRTKLRRQMDALTDALRLEAWSDDDAGALLAGFLPDPEPGRPDSKGRGSHLPGIEPPLAALRESWNHAQAECVTRMTRRWRTINRDGLTEPRAVLALALERGIVPPWWPVASADLEYAALLPENAKASQRPIKGRRKLTDLQRREKKQKAARVRWADPQAEPAHNALLTIGRRRFEEEKQKDFRDHRWGEHVNAAALARTIDDLIQNRKPNQPEAWLDRSTIVDHVRIWLKETRDAKADSRDATA